ncbi:MAG: diphthine--ammonia ligase [Candidatus Omnitrophota bacterium]|jgi:uncharacterized protein (TIGR00290 family)
MITPKKEKILFCWSAGKDSAMALYKLHSSGKYEIACLLTTVTEGYDRVGMHGVRRELLKKQVKELGIPCEEVFIPKDSSNGEYEARMQAVLSKYHELGVEKAAFGDIFLEDVAGYRLSRLAKIGMKAIFPLWGSNTSELALEFINTGFKAVITCVDTQFLDRQFCGKEFDKEFVASLPAGVDPCGENGEFHTFVFAGPLFTKNIDYDKGDIVLRDNRFYYCDLLP